MTVKAYTRLELAANQLRAAIGLFVSGGDRFSVITLAGAADVILARLVTNSGQTNFTEHMLEKQTERDGSKAGNKEELGRDVNNLLFINQLKHLDDGGDEHIDLDPEECALAAILKALANYVALAGKGDDFVQAFFAWVMLNLDPQKYNLNQDPNWKRANSAT